MLLQDALKICKVYVCSKISLAPKSALHNSVFTFARVPLFERSESTFAPSSIYQSKNGTLLAIRTLFVIYHNECVSA